MLDENWVTGGPWFLYYVLMKQSLIYITPYEYCHHQLHLDMLTTKEQAWHLWYSIESVWDNLMLGGWYFLLVFCFYDSEKSCEYTQQISILFSQVHGFEEIAI